VRTFEEFSHQVIGLVETAADYGCRLVVFPEYFTLQLLTLGNVRKPIDQQVRDLSNLKDRYVELMSELAKQHDIYICGGTIISREKNDDYHNDCYFFSPNGEFGVQGKLHMTRFEKEDWFIRPRRKLKIFDTDFGRCAVNICYDVEFPEVARAAAREGANILIVPSCTDDRQGFLRVRYCAQARAIENQIYVIHSGTVGSLPMVPAVCLNYGQAAILTPSDFHFSRDGILSEGIPNQETMVLGELNLKTINDTRTDGTVLPLIDSMETNRQVQEPELVNL
jgi:predicted amidohydrolase